MPVLATHVAYRFGHDLYNADDETIRRIAARGGVIGLIIAEHQAGDGFPHTKTQADSIDLLCRHADRIAAIAGSHRHTAIGTDLDGFIKPTLAGLEDSSRLPGLENGLRERYGDADAELITSGNVLRVLRSSWGGAVA